MHNVRKRLLLVLPLLVFAVVGTWYVGTRSNVSSRTCLPSDRACLTDTLNAAFSEGVLAQMQVLSRAAALEPAGKGAVCTDLGFSLGAAAEDPAVGIASLLSSAAAELECRNEVLSGLLQNWSTRALTTDPDILRAEADELVRSCVDTPADACAEIVATGAALTQPAVDAVRVCYRYTTAVGACLRVLAQNLLDLAGSASDRDPELDPRETLVALCDSWPVDGAGQDCSAAVAPAFFSSAFGALGFKGAIDPQALNEAIGYCRRLGSGDLTCQREAFDIPPRIGMVGEVNSERRSAYCTLFDVSLREECLELPAGAVTGSTAG